MAPGYSNYRGMIYGMALATTLDRIAPVSAESGRPTPKGKAPIPPWMEQRGHKRWEGRR